jgi:hypothetical protein
MLRPLGAPHLDPHQPGDIWSPESMARITWRLVESPSRRSRWRPSPP